MSTKSKKRRGIWSVLVIGFSAFLFSVILLQINTIYILELKFIDQLFEWRGPLEVEDSPIVMVAMSENADYDIPQKYPWPTSVYARLVENLNEAGAKVVAFDVIFQQPDNYDLRNDTLFANAMKKYGNVILAGDIEVKIDKDGNKSVTPIFPRPMFMNSNPNPLGFVKVEPDIDGSVRHYRFGYTDRDSSYLMLALEALKLYKNIPDSAVEPLVKTEKKTFDIGSYSIPRVDLASFIINYYGPEETFPVVSFEEVIDDSTYTTVSETEAGFEYNTFDDPYFGLIGQDIFEDKIVIVGSTMPVLKDFYPTPFASGEVPPRPGYEIHANALQTILDENYITRAKDWVILLLMFSFSMIVVFLNRFVSATAGIISSVVLLGIYFFSVYQAFMIGQVLVMFIGPLLAIVSSQVGMVSYEYFMEQREKRRIKGMFSSYVSPDLVDQMVESGEEPQLGGEEIYMTAFFSDIESFSTFSEKLEAKQLVQLINDYLSAMTDIVNDRGGTLDKYIGDAIVAFFGAPVFMEDHALQACISSQLMQKKLGELREKWAKEDWPDIVANMKNRIGMNTGIMVTGNMGSTRRFNYTMMGDNVNLAARCESGAKQFGVYTMVTESTKEDAEKFGDDCVFRLLDNIVVKGRTQPVKVYEIADLRSDASQQLFDCIGTYEEGMEKYFRREWDAAIAKFEESLKLERYDNNPSKIFIERCRLMKEDPPGEDWDGVFVMKSK